MKRLVCKKRIVQFFVCAVSIIMLILCCGAAAFASQKSDPTAEVTLRVHIADEGRALKGVGFSLYQLATRSEDGQYNVTPQFAGDEELLKKLLHGDEAWNQYIDHFKARCYESEAYAAEATDDGGNAVFSSSSIGKKLPQGLYFILPDVYSGGGWKYQINSSFVALPSRTEDDNWVYDVDADFSNKFDRNRVSSGGSGGSTATSRKVVKIWDDNGFTDLRPDSITVSLIRDGKAYSTVDLNASNNWSYTWTGLDTYYEWLVSEAVIPEGYTSVITRDGAAFRITNTYNGALPAPAPGNNNRRLPQTGLLWWIVPSLALAGVILFLIGLLMRRKGSGCEKQDQ